MKFLARNCREVTRLVLAGEDRRLSWFERLLVRYEELQRTNALLALSAPGAADARRPGPLAALHAGRRGGLKRFRIAPAKQAVPGRRAVGKA